ncbi:hypothetical protein [Neobacillus jeddahensis]|nr:hypothetical protein [Neobacillus jeddahensis]
MSAIWWVTTIGFVLCLGLVAGTLFHFLNKALHSDDAARIDELKSEQKPD